MDDLTARLATDLDSAFPDFVRAFQRDLYSGLRRISGPDAEDLTQETFIRAYRALEGYDAGRIRDLRLSGWIWTIALNLGRNHARSRSRRPTVALSVEPEHTDPDPADEASWNRRIAALSPRQRKAVVLRHVVGLGYAEIAEALGSPEGTVKADVHRGLERLRAIIEEETR